MAKILFTNGAQTALNGAITNSATTLVILSLTGFPSSLAAGEFFYIAIEDELVKITAMGGTGNLTWTAARGVDGTTDAAHANGATVTNVLNKEAMDYLRDSGGHIIQDEGGPLAQRAGLNFVGAGVTVADDSANNRTEVTIAGGGSSATGVLLTGAADPGVPALTSLQAANGNAGGGVATTVVAFPSGVLAGSLLVAAIAPDNSAVDAIVSDTRGNTYTKLGTTGSNGKHLQMWACISGSSGANSVTCTVTGGQYVVVAIWEASGDVTATMDAQSTGTSPQPITTVTPYAIVVSAATYYGAFAFTTSGATTIVTNVNAGQGSIVLGYQIQAAPGTLTNSLNTGGVVYLTRAIQPAALASVGNNGDWYLQDTSGILWGPKTAGVWGHSGWKFTAE